MKISIVIPNYNGKDILLTNLPFVLEAVHVYKAEKKEIIIADDASKDGSVEILQEWFVQHEKKYSSISSKIIINTTGKNRGFSSNVNIGVRQAVGDIVVLLNSDVRPHKDF